MNMLRKMSIRGKLTVICMLTSMFALCAAGFTIFSYEVHDAQTSLVAQYSSIAQAASPFVAGSLRTPEDRMAKRILSNFVEYRDVLAGAIYRADGALFAKTVRRGIDADVVPDQPLPDGYRNRNGDLLLFEPVFDGNDRSGTLLLLLNVPSAKERALTYTGLIAAVLVVTLATTFLLATLLVPLLTRPIRELVHTTRSVSDQQNFSVRAVRTSKDELGDLVESFNAMLDHINERDSELAKQREQLEAEVAARTDDIRKFALAIEQSPSTTIITDIDGHVEYVNRRFTETTGYTLEEALAQNPDVLTTGELPDKDKATLDLSQQVGKVWLGQFPNKRKNGEVFWESAKVAPLRGSDGHVTHFVWIKEDITERKKAEDALRESEDRYALAAQGANDGLWDWDLRTDSIYFSTRWKVMLGYWDDELSASPSEWFDRIDKRDIEVVRQKIDDHLNGKSPHFQHEYRMKHKDGSYRWMLSRGVCVFDENGVAYRFAGSQTDITDRKQAEEKLFYDASHDPLTGLPNRGLLFERLANAVARAKRNGGFKFALLFLDLDRFKVINDSLGHAVGDELLIEVSRRLGLCVREQDTIARLGGDEFAVLLEGIENDKDPIRVAERIQAELTRSYRLLDTEVFTSSSIGIAHGSHGYDTPEDMLRDADAAMYRAKSQGKAQFALFDTELHEKALRRLQLENDLRHAIDRNEFTLHYQPIVSLTQECTVGFEALVRWEHHEHGMVPPKEFVTIAEETGMIASLGYWILEEACRQLAQWHAELDCATLPSVSVNISGKQFLQRDFVPRVQSILDKTGVDGAYLKLEISESVVLENVAAVRNGLHELHALGIELCIDDFGTGYSSLSCLREYPFDVLKVDKSFVNQLDHDAESLEIVQAIVGLAKNLRLRVVAEGVESEGQIAHLANLRCEAAQGYVIARPMAAADVLQYLTGRGEIAQRDSAVT